MKEERNRTLHQTKLSIIVSFGYSNNVVLVDSDIIDLSNNITIRKEEYLSAASNCIAKDNFIVCLQTIETHYLIQLAQGPLPPVVCHKVINLEAPISNQNIV